MEVITTITDLRGYLDRERLSGRSIGFVPTMGALHKGHQSLVKRSTDECDRTVLSIFVNPLQFGPQEDLDAYPRTFDADAKLAKKSGAAIVFAPTVAEMYPVGKLQTMVRVGELGETLEGLSRPGHFDGVATVVAKLFSIVGACHAYFGEKDWQQLAIVRQMVTDLSMSVTVVGCPTVRERDGLALSSRNAYLDDDQRRAASVLSRALQAGVDLVKAGQRLPLPVITAMTEVLRSQPLVQTEYAAVVDEKLRMPSTINSSSRLLVAARVGSTRLIDNQGVIA